MRRNASIDVAIRSRMIFVHIELEIMPFQVANISRKINRGKIARARARTRSCESFLLHRNFLSIFSRPAFRVSRGARPGAVRCSCKVPSVKVTRAARIASRPFLLYGLHLPLCAQWGACLLRIGTRLILRACCRWRNVAHTKMRREIRLES